MKSTRSHVELLVSTPNIEFIAVRFALLVE